MISPSLERPVLAVDLVMFRMAGGRLEVLLRRRQSEPFGGARTLPGAAVHVEETLEGAARRTLRAKTEWSAVAAETVYIEQLATFDALYRDPRGRTVSVAHLGIARTTSVGIPGDDWQPIQQLPKGSLPFDHDEILETARVRLGGKLRYTNIAREFLEPSFRIEALQEVYEAVLGRALNRTNFRNKLLKIGMIELVSVLSTAVGRKGGRPPHLYRFCGPRVEAVDRDFL